jgi:drug/metabolite transporter (DMT)-like permease
MFNFPYLKAYCFLCLAQIMVGVNIVGSKFLLPKLSVLFLLTIRFSFAAVILLFLHFLTGNSAKNSIVQIKGLTKKDWFFIFAQALTAGVFFNLTMLWGLHYTDANIAGIVTSALPALTAVLSCLVFRQKFTFKLFLCIAFATLGLFVISVDKLSELETHSSFFGILIVFCSLIPEAGYYILSKCHPHQLPVFLLSALLNGINAVILWPCLLLYPNDHFQSLNIQQWIILLSIGLSSGLFYVCWYLGALKINATKAALTTALMPIATVLIAWFALGEMIGFIQFMGMSLVILSIIIYVAS